MKIYYKVELNEKELAILLTALYWYSAYYIRASEDIDEDIDEYGDKIAKLYKRLIDLNVRVD